MVAERKSGLKNHPPGDFFGNRNTVMQLLPILFFNLQTGLAIYLKQSC
jgi:hypothetical protein